MVTALPRGDHRLRLRGLDLDGSGPRAEPTVLAIPGFDALDRVLADLQQPQTRAQLATHQLRPNAQATATLWQPVHRYLHVVLLEAVCEHPGAAVAVDRRAIASAGLCLRREAGPARLAWMRRNGQLLGWQPVVAGDPDPQRRLASAGAAAERARRLGLIASPPADQEDTSPLFVAPPAVCAACGTTVLAGILNTGSAEYTPQAERPAGFTLDFVATSLPQFLRANPKSSFGLEGHRLHQSELDAPSSALRRLVEGLSWCVDVIGLGGESDTYAAFAAQLDRLSADGEPLSAFLLRAHRFCVRRDAQAADDGDRLRLPETWPRGDLGWQRQTVRLAFEGLLARWDEIAPAAGRFEVPEARYHLAPFARLRGERGCPERICWSAPLGPFAIAPWYEGSDVPPPVIDLPDVDAATIGRMKPNAAFRIGPKLKAMMDSAGLKGLVDQERPGEGGWEVMWICRIPIPIITIVAFFVFNIFLSICIWIFFWFSLVLKICIPIPIPKNEEG